MPLCERRRNEVRDARISLVKEHKSRDEAIQNEIRKKYSLSEEIALLRKEVKKLKESLSELLQIETLTDNAMEFDDYNAYVEECKIKIKEEGELDG